MTPIKVFYFDWMTRKYLVGTAIDFYTPSGMSNQYDACFLIQTHEECPHFTLIRMLECMPYTQKWAEYLERKKQI